jgi:hypothetical protein
VGSCTSLGQQQKKGASVLRWLTSADFRGLGVGAIAMIRAMVRWQNNNGTESGVWHLPVAGGCREFYAVLLAMLVLLVRLLGLSVASLFTDVNFLVVLRGLGTTLVLVLLLGDMNLLLDVRVAVVRLLGTVDGSCEGFVCLFVTFPSD